jgi:hypothetical protein
MTNIPIFLLLLILCGCQEPSREPTERSWQTIHARDNGVTLERIALYRARIPTSWSRKDPPPNESIADTKKPLCEFLIGEDKSPIRLKIHTFPIATPEAQVPPQAQIARWRSQFEQLNPLDVRLIAESHGGFSGLRFEGKGEMNGENVQLLGWSMNLASDYVRKLAMELSPTDRLKRADYTIKATGHPSAMGKHRDDIIAFANSFELIDELPKP